MRVPLVALVLMACGPSTTTKSGAYESQAPASPLSQDVVITSEHQLPAAVGHFVTIVGVQTRTKIPTVCGVDVDGDYSLSDREVVARGILESYTIRPRAKDDPIVASRGPGTYYSVIDPATRQLAKTSLNEDR